MKTRTFLKALALPFAYPTTSSFAQTMSGRPIRVVVPLPAGTAIDFVARLLLTAASKTLNQTIIVDNKPGANGLIGTMEVVRAAPDGFTLLCATNSHMAVNMALVKNLPYDPRKDLTPIAGGIEGGQVLVVNANSPIRTFADFIAYGKQNPGKLSVGYSTSVVQLEFATLGKMVGMELLPVPYKGAPAAVNDVIGGVIDATMDVPGLAIPHIKAGKLRALAVAAKRIPLMPDTPAISETLPGFDFPTWNGFLGPAGMPRELVLKLNAAIVQAQRQPEIALQLRNAGTPPFIIEPDNLKTYIEAEITKYVRLAREAGIQPE